MNIFVKIFSIIFCCHFVMASPMDLAKDKLKMLYTNYIKKDLFLHLCENHIKNRPSTTNHSYHKFIITILLKELDSLKTAIKQLYSEIQTKKLTDSYSPKGLAQTLLEWANIDYTKFKPGDKGIFYDLFGNECFYLVTKAKNIVILIPSAYQKYNDCALRSYINGVYYLGRWESEFESNLKTFLTAVTSETRYQNLVNKTCNKQQVKAAESNGLTISQIKKYLNSDYISTHIPNTHNYFTLLPEVCFNRDLNKIFLLPENFLSYDSTFIDAIKNSTQKTNLIFELSIKDATSIGHHAVAIRHELLDNKHAYLLIDSSNGGNKSLSLNAVYGVAIDVVTSLIFKHSKETLLTKLALASPKAKNFAFSGSAGLKIMTYYKIT